MITNRIFYIAIIFTFACPFILQGMQCSSPSDQKKNHKRERLAANRMLLHALARNDFVEAARALQFGADINEHFEGGLTHLHRAAAIGNINQILWLLRQGADPRSRDDNGHRPRLLDHNIAMRMTHLQILDLIAYGVTIDRVRDRELVQNVVQNHPERHLLAAAIFGDVDVVQRLLPNFLEMRLSLRCAAAQGHALVAGMILQEFTRLSSLFDEWNPQHLLIAYEISKAFENAALNGRVEVIKRMLELWPEGMRYSITLERVITEIMTRMQRLLDCATLTLERESSYREILKILQSFNQREDDEIIDLFEHHNGLIVLGRETPRAARAALSTSVLS